MSLRHQQDLLARLYTEHAFRSRFLQKPSAFAEEAKVSAEQAEALARVAAAEVQWFAESLVNKRLREAAKLLPLTNHELGSGEFERRFRNFAAGFSPRSTKKHLEDALFFASTLIEDRSVDLEMRNIIRFESKRLRHNSLAPRCSICFLRFDPRRRIHLEPANVGEGFGLWIAIGSWSRILFCRIRKSPGS